MIADGDITKEQMDQPLELDEETKKLLPAKVREHLSKTTLHQAMTHKAGFTDYLCHDGGYMSRLGKGETLNPQDPQDFLQFAADEVHDFEPGTKSRYSNTGILLAGLAALHHYNKDRSESEKKTYQELLEEKVLRPAEIESFSVVKPENAMFDGRDSVAPKINGSPAGGYWITLQDMQKFGKWLCEKWREPAFKGAVQAFGQEFFNAESQTMQHSGGIPGTGDGVPGSTSWFSVNPEKNLVVVAGSKTSGATLGLGATIAINKELEPQQREKEPLTYRDPQKKSAEAEDIHKEKSMVAKVMRSQDTNFHDR
jgi:CubicO group peptidase (beta-lactamase class C family)